MLTSSATAEHSGRQQVPDRDSNQSDYIHAQSSVDSLVGDAHPSTYRKGDRLIAEGPVGDESAADGDLDPAGGIQGAPGRPGSQSVDVGSNVGEPTVGSNVREPTGLLSDEISESHITVRRISLTAVTIRCPVIIAELLIQAVVDTGAEVTILNTSTFNRLPEHIRSRLRTPSVGLVVADKERQLPALGVLDLTMEINGYEFDAVVYVAPIADSLLLGSDVLDAQDLVVSSRRGLWVRDSWVPCDVTRRPIAVRVVKVPEDIILPPSSEVVFQVTNENRTMSHSHAVMEPTAEDERGIVIARTLVDTSRPSIPVRLVNTSEEPLRLRKGHQIGELESVSDVTEIVTPGCSIREVKVTDEPDSVHDSSSEATNITPEALKELVEEEASSLPEFLRDLYIDTAMLYTDTAVRKKLHTLLHDKQDAFAKNKMDLGTFTKIKHEINTGFSAPVKQRFRPTPREFAGEEEKCLNDMLEAGVIRPSTSPWGAPTVLVRKPDRSVRYCIDYRRLNDRTEKCSYPLPSINTCLDALSGSTCFSTLDLNSGYWQISMEESSIPKTGFVTKYGAFEFVKMPFGLCTAPSTFERCIELVMRGLQWDKVLIYLDDLIIMSRGPLQNLERLAEVLQRLKEAGLKVKPSKCKFLRLEVLFLGHIVSQLGIRPNPKLIENVQNWKVPSSRTEVMQFMGLCNYYRKHIQDFSAIATPLTALTSKSITFEWSDAAQTAFEALKRVLCSAPLLSFPRDHGRYIVDTDASDYGLGCVLQQEQDGEEKVIAYGSKKLSRAQRRYCVTRKELMSIVVFLQEYRKYLLGRPFLIRTDHNSLIWLLHFKEPQGQLARWLEVIYEYQFTICHRKGKDHGAADALSRSPELLPECAHAFAAVPLKDLPCGGCAYCTRRQEEWDSFKEIDDVIPLGARRVQTRGDARRAVQAEAAESTVAPDPQLKVADQKPPPIQKSSGWAHGYSFEQLRQAQQADPDLQPVLDWVKQGERPSREVVSCTSPATRCYWNHFQALKLIDGVLYLVRPAEDGSPVEHRLVVPKSLRSEVLAHCHDALFSAHLGVNKTYDRVRQRFHWYALKSDVRTHIASCAVCAKAKLPYQKFKAALANFRVGAPLDRVALDVMGPLRKTERGNRYLLVITDYFTKWVECFPISDLQSETMARILVHEFVCRFGAPLEAHTDRGTMFEAALFKEACRLLDIVKTRSVPWRPPGNGLVERFNRTFESMMRCHLEGEEIDWDLDVPILAAAYRSTVHPSTGFTPNFLMLGRETTTPVDIVFPRVETSSEDLPQYVQDLQERFARCYATARQKLKSEAERQARYHDTRVSQHVFLRGDAVLKKKAQRTRKLALPFEGPFLIDRVVSDLLYVVRDKKKTFVAHFDQLKPFPVEKLPRWAVKVRSEMGV